MKLRVVIVHYQTPDLARTAVAAVLDDATVSGLEVEVVVVDNGSDAAGREILSALPATMLDAGGNRGFAGGVNLGLAGWSDDASDPEARVAVVMNPDVWVERGCLRRLCDQLEAGAAVAGPAFFWDEIGGYALPPTERIGRWAELERRLSGRPDGFWSRCALDSWRRHARRHWSAREQLDSWDLSGAMLAIRLDAWRQIGPFDEGYRLYYEETDWLQRCRRAGLVARYVPRARALHLYAQSTPSQAHAAAWLAESQRRFRRRHYGHAFDALIKRLAKSKPGDLRTGAEVVDADGSWHRLPRARWLEISPSPLGYPAAGLDLGVGGLGVGRRLVPSDLWPRLAGGDYWASAVDGDGQTLVSYRLEKQV